MRKGLHALRKGHPKSLRMLIWLYSQLLFRWEQQGGDIFRDRRGIIILLYHDVCPMDCWSFRLSPRMSVTPNNFRQQIEWMRRYFEFIDLDTAIVRISRGEASSCRAAVVSSDDGWLGFHKNAVRFLCELHIPAVVYVASCVLDHPTPWYVRWHWLLNQAGSCRAWLAAKLGLPPDTSADTLLLAMTQYDLRFVESLWDEVQQGFGGNPLDLPATTDEGYVQVEHLRERTPLLTVGAHTMHHVCLPLLSEERMREELVVAKRRLQDIMQSAVDHFAYPYGAYNKKVVEALSEAGYRSAATTLFGWNTNGQNLFHLRRVIMSEWSTTDHRGRFSDSMLWCTLTGRWERFKRFLRRHSLSFRCNGRRKM
jgi:peptidoglycan/xylan/chitin deacetylase (PgdA/CDA1 family)